MFEQYRLNIFDREGNTIYPVGVMEYTGPISIVYLKDFPASNSDVNYRENGNHMIHLFTDPADGLYKTATENLICYSYDADCVDVLLKMLPGFVGDSFRVPQGVFSVWCEKKTICYNDERICVGNLLQDENVSYNALLKK